MTTSGNKKNKGPKTDEEWIEHAKNVNETHNALKNVVSALNRYYYFENNEYNKNQKRILYNLLQRSAHEVKEMNIAANGARLNIHRKTDPGFDKICKDLEEYRKKPRENDKKEKVGV